MFGKILLYLVVLFGLISTIIYFLSDKNPNIKKIANLIYYLMTASLVGASIYLLANILQHNFQFTYIWEYSSTELHDFFLIASFYSGQQGSFLLWALILSIIGLFLIQSLKNHNLESYSMAFYTLVVFYVAFIMLFKNPFEYVWETFKNENLEVGFTPTNGRGLNPILQNYWINIHPPILFVGYSLMTVPFVMALAALIKRDYKYWINKVMPWTLVGAGILGLGIMLGGFWAYETLGWGGFWAWDPVENSSLIPWMFIVAFIHTALVQRRTGGLVKTNFLLGVLSFIFVLYATFLTRSGVLGDTSVHSFVTPGAVVYNLLLFFMIIFTLLAVIFILLRIKDINKFLEKSNFKPISKEYSLTLGSILLIALAIIVIMGTSWPAVAELFGQPKAAIDINNYNKFGAVFAFVFLLINGFSLYQRWMSSSLDDIFKRISLPLIVSLLLSIFLYLLGMKEINFLLLTFSALFALLTNLDILIRNLIKNPKLIGGYISHLGVSILIIGAIASGGYSQSTQMRLKLNETKSAFGYDFTFTGKKRIETEYTDREKYKYFVEISKPNKVATVHPIVYWSNFNDWQSPFLEPGIYPKYEKDIYVSPKAVETDFNMPRLLLMKNEVGNIPINEEIKIRVYSLNMEESPFANDGRVIFKTTLETELNGIKKFDTITTRIDPHSWEGNWEDWNTLNNYGIDINLSRILRDMNDVSKSKLEFYFKKTGEPMPKPIDVFSFDITLKPYINLVWAGTIATVVGFLIALTKYTRKNNYITQ